MALDYIPVNSQRHFACCSFTLPASRSVVYTFLAFIVLRVGLCLSNYLPFLWGGFGLQLPACCVSCRILQVLSAQTLFSTQENRAPVICIHISIWAVLLLLLLTLTHQHSAGFSFAKTGRFGLINMITRTWFCIHAHQRTLMVTYSPCDSLTLRD